MRHISTTSIGRREVTACPSTGEVVAVDKWAILRDLTDGREAFGLSDRNLSVLSALLSFHPARDLAAGPLTVFPSNASLSGRLHGMPESTLRRHIAVLIDAGVILRHDSPNGKRYAIRDGKGQIDRVFGFDLSPLLHQAETISAAAEAARETRCLTRKLRQTVFLLLRDASAVLDHQNDADICRDELAAMQRQLRRKLDLDALLAMEAALRELLGSDSDHGAETAKLGGNDARNERHQHNTDSDPHESDKDDDQQELPPLAIVLKAAPEMETYAARPVEDWRELSKLAEFVRPMMGVTTETWQSARRMLGERRASIALACILQRFTQIRSPGAYLRRLSMSQNLDVGPMVMALLRSGAACPS